MNTISKTSNTPVEKSLVNVSEVLPEQNINMWARLAVGLRWRIAVPNIQAGTLIVAVTKDSYGSFRKLGVPYLGSL